MNKMALNSTLMLSVKQLAVIDVDMYTHIVNEVRIVLQHYLLNMAVSITTKNRIVFACQIRQ